ncbi:tenascin-X isoform X5 [Anolis carolinensis]|uniref:tenascin-X isoform X5 n=1 Tax=Anolis carolinensis TaxID=28377 RepID=UPI002F2B7BDF
MGRPPNAVSLLLFLFCLETSWETQVPRSVSYPSNATVFSHVYTIKLAGDVMEGEGATSLPQEALGPPGSSHGGGLYEHTLEGPDQEHVVFTHRINLPQQSCGCAPGTEDTRELLKRLQALENEVRTLRDTCQAGSGCCPATAPSQASTGQTDIRTLCSHHGSFDLSRCQCECEPGWGGPTCAEPACPGGCGGPQRGKCANGRCQCRPGYSGTNCEEPPSCPDDCNDQGRCVDGRCSCFPGYVGPSCSDPACPQDCQGHGQCVSGRCVCNPGYSGLDCGTRSCPSNCNRRGECRNGRCICEPGFTGPACGTKSCPNDCNQRGRCLKGGACACHKGYTGPDCGQVACPEDCSGHGECQNGVCLCHDGYSGDDCATEIPSIGVRVSNRDETSFRLEWNRPQIPVDAYEIHMVPKKTPRAGESVRLSGTETTFERRGLTPGEEYTVTIRAEKGQRYGPPVSQTVQTRVAPPRGLRSSQVTENSITLQWEPPVSHCEGYVLSYVPVVTTRPAQATKRVELPPTPEMVTLEELESNTRYRITLVARQSGESSRATTIVTSTTAPTARQPVHQYSTPSPSSHLRPGISSTRPESPNVRPGTSTHLEFPNLRPGTSSNYPESPNVRLGTSTYPVSPNVRPGTSSTYPQPPHVRPDTSSTHPESPNVRPGTSTRPDSPNVRPDISSTRPQPPNVRPDISSTRPQPPNVRPDISSTRPQPPNVRPDTSSTHSEPPNVRPGTSTHPKPPKVRPDTSSTHPEPPNVRPDISSTRPQPPHVRPDTSSTHSEPPNVRPGTSTHLKPPKVRPDTSTHPQPPNVKPDTSSTHPQPPNVKPDTSTHPQPPNVRPGTSSISPESSGPPDHHTTPVTKEVFLKKITQNISAKLSPYNGTLLERLKSYLRATNFPVQGNRTIENVARDIYIYLIRWKPKEFQDRVRERLVKETNSSFPAREFPIGETDSVYSDGYIRSDHAKPSVITSSPESMELLLDGVRGVSENVIIRFRDMRSGEGGEVVVPGDASKAIITGLAPGTTYQVEIHGVVKGHSSKSYSFITATAPASPTPAKAQPVLSTTRSPVVSLTDLTVTEVSPSSLHVTWSAPPNSFRGFSFQYRDPKSNATPGEIRLPGTERSVNVTGLSPRTDYELQLYGEKPNGLYEGPITSKASTAPASAAEKPSLGGISVLEVTDNAARLSWSVATGTFDSFLIQYKDAEGKLKSLPLNGDLREAIISELVPSRKYKFNLYGLVGRKRHGPVSTEAVTVKPEKRLTAPPGLGELSASDITSDSVHLSWSVPSGSFDSFVIQFKDAEGRPQVIPAEGDVREVTIPSLAPSRKYRFNLYGISNRKRLGPATTDVTTAPREEETTPEAVLGDLSVSDTTSDSIRLIWSVPIGNFDSFLIQYQDSEGNDQSLPVNQDFREATIANLTPSQRYRFNLYGISGSQHLGPVSADAVTAAKETKKERPGDTVSVQPTLGELSASDVTSDSVLLSWTVPTGNFDSFLIQYKDAQGKTQAQPIEGDFREATIPNLSPSRRYKFNLYGISGRKRSSPISTEATTASTPGSPEAERGTAAQPSLGKLSVSDVTNNSLRLSWTVHTGSFDSFLVQYKDAEGKAQALPVGGDAREVIIPSLAHSHRYKFNLYGVSGRKRSSPLTTEATTASQESEDPTPVHHSLGELSLSDVTNNSVRLSWTIPTGSFDSFQVQYKDAGGKFQALPVKGDSREVVIPNLVPSHRYKFNLYGVADRKRLGPVSIDAITASVSQESEEETAVQPSLGELSVSDITTDSVRLSWTVRTGSFDSFLVHYKDAKGKPQSLPVEGDAREVIVPNLVPSRRYKFNLYGVSGRKRSGPFSIDATTAAMATSPEVTTERVTTHLSLDQLSVSDVTSNSVRLSWVVPTGNFDSFLVQYKDPQGRLQALPVDGISRTLTVPNLEPAQRYRFNLYGVFGSKRYGPLPVMALTASVSPSLPEQAGVSVPQPKLGNFSSFDISSDSLKLAWTVLSGPSFDSFLIQYKDAEGKPQALPVGPDAREVTISNLAPSHKYKFHLYGVSGTKRIGSLSTEAVTAPLMEKPTPPLRLGQLTASNLMPNSLDLSWTVEEGNFDSFIIQYRDAQNRSQALPVDGNLRSLHLHDLVPSHRYQINLYGVSGRKRLGPISTEAETAPLPTTPPPLPPPQPTLGDLSVSDVTSNSILLSWSVPTGSFDSFSIQYKDAEGKPQMLPVEGESREITVPNLVPSRRYKFNLYGISGRKRVGPISADTVTASLPQEPPVPPSLGQLSASDITSDSVRLSWTVPTGSFDNFQVQYKDANGKLQTIPVEGVLREIIISNLAPSRRYKFNLYGFTGRKRLGPISTDAVTASPPAETRAPPSLGQLSVSNVTSDSVHLTWTVHTGNFDSFLIQYKDAEGKPQALPLDASTRETTITSLSPSRRYKFNLYGIAGRKRLGPASADAVTASPAKKEESVQPSLGELSISDLTSNSALLSWTVLTGSFDSFLIQYKDAEGKPQSLPVEGPSRKVTVSNLAPSRRYKFNLYGLSGRKRLGPVSSEATTVEPEEEEKEEEDERRKPRLGELLVSETNSDSVRLFWSVPVGRFDSFLVQYEDGDDDVQTVPVDGDSREVTIPNLAPSQRYQFDLYGITGGETLGPISTDTFTASSAQEQQVKETSTPTPEPNLGELSVSEVTSDSVRLSWDVPRETFDSFVVQYTDAENKPQEIPVDKDTNSVVIYYLVPFYRYTFYLYGISERRRLGPVSISIVTAITEDEKQKEEAHEEAPVGMEPRLGKLTVSEVSNNAAHLTWTVPQGNFDSFSIQYKDADGRNQAFPVAGGSREAMIPNLTPSHKYRFNLYGISGSRRLGPISANAVTTAMTTTHDEKPQNVREEPVTEVPTGTESRLGKLTVPEVTSNAARLSWTVPLGTFDSFLIQYKDAEGRSHMLPVGGGSREVVVPNLVPSHKYKFNLYGISGQQRLGPISANVLTTAASDKAPPPRPTLGELSASDINSTSVRLSWNVLLGNFDSFIVQYRDAEGKPHALPVDRNSHEVVIYNLVPSRRYKFNLYGISGRKRLGPVSAEVVTERMEEPEIRPTLGDLFISEVTQDSVRLSWTISAGKFNSFLIQYNDAEGKPQTVPADAEDRTVVISDLMNSHRYKFNLYGILGRKRIGPISTDAVTAFPDASNESATLLENLVVSEVTPTSLKLTWEVPEGEFDVFLVRGKESLLGSGRSPPPPKEMTVMGNERSAVLRGLSPNTEYGLTVFGIREGNQVANINTAARTSGLELDSPRDLWFNDIRETSVVANWRPASSRIDHYKVSFQLSDGGEPKSILVDGSKLKTPIEGLTPGASYEVTVMSLRGFEESEPLVGYVTTVPDGPSDLRAINITDSSAVLTWHPAMAEMNNYIVTYGPVGDHPLISKQMANSPSSSTPPDGWSSPDARVSESVPGNRVQLRVSGLRRDTEYRASVYGEKEGNRSSPISATFTTGVDGPRDLRASEISARSARLTWLPPRATPGGYLLSYETPYGQLKEISLDANITSYEIQDLIPSTSYQAQVQALRRGMPTAPTSTSFTTERLTYPFPRDCSEESLNGPGPSRVTTIYLGGNRERPLQVYCDMETDGGGWIVFQRRMNGETDFWRDWQDYVTGFGNLTREFWLGNTALHQLTSSGDYELRVDLRAGNESVYANYQSFRVDSPADYYRLHLGSYSGTAGDAFSYHSGSVFSTRDRDPNRLIISCAVSYRGAWWYRNCHYANLNGLYANNRDHQGINWFNWKGFEFSIPFTEMKLRPRGFQPLRRA